VLVAVRAQRRRFDNLIEFALIAGHVTLRRARMEPGTRYKIDARDPAVTTVYLSTELTVRDHREVWDAVCVQLHEICAARRRHDLAPVVELEAEQHAASATGTDSVTGDLHLSDLRARERRAGFGLVPDPRRL
jgi:hypothetical protein